MTQGTLFPRPARPWAPDEGRQGGGEEARRGGGIGSPGPAHFTSTPAGVSSFKEYPLSDADVSWCKWKWREIQKLTGGKATRSFSGQDDTLEWRWTGVAGEVVVDRYFLGRGIDSGWSMRRGSPLCKWDFRPGGILTDAKTMARGVPPRMGFAVDVEPSDHAKLRRNYIFCSYRKTLNRVHVVGWMEWERFDRLKRFTRAGERVGKIIASTDIFWCLIDECWSMDCLPV